MRRTIILVTLIAATGLPALPQERAPAADDALNPVVMTVNGEAVRAAEISMVMLNLRAQVERSGAAPTPAELLEVASQRVIEQKLLAQEARRFGLAPETDAVSRLLQAAEAQAGGRDQLEKNLAASGSSTTDLHLMLEEMNLAQQFIKTRIEPTVKVPGEAVERYYADHADRFTADLRIRPRHIVFAVPADADAATVERIRARAEAARARVLAGEPFAEVARDVSEGPSAARGGDIGLVPPSALEPEFAAAAERLAIGEVSDIVRTPFGFHVITLDERRPAGVVPLAEVRTSLEAQLRQQLTAKTVTELLKTLAERAKIEIVQGQAPADGETRN